MKSVVNKAIFLISLFAVNLTSYGNMTNENYAVVKRQSFLKLNRIKKAAFVLSSILGQNIVAANCNVCRNGGDILDPEKEFTMTNSDGDTITWTCGFLQESMADVLASGGAPGEARWCALGQLWAEKECTCSGDPLPPVPPKDPNAACDLCRDLPNKDPYDFDYVPEEMEDELVDTGYFGRMSCGGLYLALAEGVIPNGKCL